jgi:transposase
MGDIENLPDDIGQLKHLVWDYYQQINHLQDRVALLQAALYAPKSEKSKDLFQGILPLPLVRIAEEEPKPAEVPVIEVPAHTRAKRGRKPLPDHLPRIEITHDLPEDQKVCACGACLKRIGEDVSEKLDYVPAVMQVERHIRPKYACPACDGEEGMPVVRIAPVPPQIIPKGIATPNLLAQVITAKFVDAMPFYRQTKQFARLGADIPRHSMSGWAMAVAKALEPFEELFRAEIRSGPLINMDETTLQVFNEPGRSDTSTSYLWLFRGGNPKRPTVAYRYDPTRSGSVPKEYLGEYKGYIQTDGYSGYQALGESDDIVHVGCMAHIRRKFVDVQKATSKKIMHGTAKEVLDLIGLLYKVEHNIKELEPEKKVPMRLEQAVPILDAIRAILDERIDHVPPKSLLGQAMTYARNQWNRVVRYVDCELLTPDNNAAENAIRPVALGRKNWLFAGVPKGADASAMLFSLVETAKANEIEPQSYLKFLFERFPAAQTTEEMRALMPQHVDRSLLPRLPKPKPRKK